MRTFLLTWNPLQYTAFKPASMVRTIQSGKAALLTWSCGRSHQPRQGDRVYFLKQGPEPRGLIGSGTATSSTYVRGHWAAESSRDQRHASYIDTRFTSFIDPEVTDPLDPTHFTGVLAAVHWIPQSSGTEVRGEAAILLEKIWRAYVAGSPPRILEEDPAAQFLEGRKSRLYVTHRQRERRLRAAKLAQAKLDNDGRLLCEVPGCGFDFEQVYGQLGAGYAQVHHLRQMSKLRGRAFNTVDDVAVVCANCHAMIHLGGECRNLDAIMKQRRRTRK